MHMSDGRWVSEEPIREWDDPYARLARGVERDCENLCKPGQNKVGARVPDAPCVYGQGA